MKYPYQGNKDINYRCKKLLTRECNKCLEPFTLYPYDLLCSLYDYDCMALAIENCLLDGGQLK